MTSTTNPTPQSRWYRLTPDRFVIGLLVVECLLWLSERFRWFGFNSHKGWTVLIVLAVVAATILLMLLWFAIALVFRRTFQFSIRSLLFLVLVVAVPCSWLAVEMKKARKQQEAVEALIGLNCGFEYDYEVQFDPSSGLQIEEEWYPGKPDAMPLGSAWLRKCLGNDFFNSLYEVDCNRSPVSDADLAHFEGLTSLVELRMSDTGVSDLGLERLNGLTNLQYLGLSNTRVTDAGVKKLQQALQNCQIHH